MLNVTAVFSGLDTELDGRFLICFKKIKYCQGGVGPVGGFGRQPINDAAPGTMGFQTVISIDTENGILV